MKSALSERDVTGQVVALEPPKLKIEPLPKMVAFSPDECQDDGVKFTKQISVNPITKGILRNQQPAHAAPARKISYLLVFYVSIFKLFVEN